MPQSSVPESTTGYTPGPWVHDPIADDVITATGEAICVPPDDYDEDAWQRNAPLIAAAPELLAACKFAHMVMHGNGVFEAREKALMEKLEAAIAKAEARP
jgi:hypothetical protein